MKKPKKYHCDVARFYTEAKIVQIIKVEFKRGCGSPGCRIREVTRWFTTNGELIAERDMEDE
jgi:hypothetical protein